MFCIIPIFSQETQNNSLENLFRLNFLSPGLGFDWAVSDKSLISTDLGIGYSGAFDEITLIENNGFQYVIAPFIGVQYKLIYNRDKRMKEGKPIAFNSGNFVSIRVRGRGASIADNVTRTDDVDFLIGPTWGLQRAFGKLHFLVDVGPTYYFDTLGNSGFFPLNIQVKLGLNLSNKEEKGG
ncbi:hypothetical protein [Flavivirga spongiicola]|uniref:Outer membrane protein beta-barrel domain-containing protein n=1 Tax=Flavivirga spongiicola TaxID=421621 RepID=A0ABU7XQN6_9FLAO|nr:hypothetical protein [Flavivirga sp. MEBiC05379]MDO5981858.1 hypothetical protein [Flavivirga sp. MEBiC05379]